MKRTRWCRWWLFGLAVLVSLPVSAQQEADVPQNTEPVAPADAELVPDAGGPAKDSKVVGDSDAREAADAEPAAADKRRNKVKLQFHTTQEGVTFHYARLTSPDSTVVPSKWTRLCMGYCDAMLKPGHYRFALSHGASKPEPAPFVFEATSSGRLEGGYTDRSGRRLAGWLVLGVVGISSLATATTGATLLINSRSADDEVGAATLAGGAVGVLLSLLIGAPLAATSDEAAVFAARAER